MLVVVELAMFRASSAYDMSDAAVAILCLPQQPWRVTSRGAPLRARCLTSHIIDLLNRGEIDQC